MLAYKERAVVHQHSEQIMKMFLVALVFDVWESFGWATKLRGELFCWEFVFEAKIKLNDCSIVRIRLSVFGLVDC